ncbi:pyridoxal 5'-phosphate synthase glutaminase subunit PdxT [Georgenia sp. TF02-10]|uniref:pyridoxal 5'-phosphate synthase glutaminase subunit PdxT n=1 Tax=Georgenia sp. TF02-10 TaxID=2917725 RepID=UPI001FA7B2C4|nr:pyridoxal 5'-phosphate synthase glutaminase subunit PdxT [Georgenia sp. TF02-10]UNX53282.1 pyridoxal 5'-phosphate synthase glutaminase subunit PdxT [Georgenia sp. TF02-10]
MTASPPPPRVGVLALQGDVREHLAALTAAGAQAVPVRRPAELAAVDGLVLPGGESTTIEKLLRAFDLFAPLRERITGGLPVFGSCAGMILLADRVRDATADQQTLGGIDMTVRRNAFGRQVDSFEEDLRAPAVTGEGPDLHAVFIRAPWVEEVGADVEVLARTGAGSVVADGGRRTGESGATADDAAAATDDTPSTPGEATAAVDEGAADRGGSADGKIVAVRHGRLLATAFHPEIGGDARVHRYFVEMILGATTPGGRQQR